MLARWPGETMKCMWSEFVLQGILPQWRKMLNFWKVIVICLVGVTLENIKL
jgi:hypothetical protein